MMLSSQGHHGPQKPGTAENHPTEPFEPTIGEVRSEPPGIVVLVTGFGGTRIVDMLVGDPLPRIC